MQNRKDLASIIADHDVPYVAQTTLTTDFKDLHLKAEKAIYTEGACFLNIMAPCPRGWRYDTAEIMKICKLAVETCYWPLFEVDHGKWTLTYEPKKKLPIEDFLKEQGRFKHLFQKGNEDLLVVTNKGVMIRISLEQVKVASRNTQGVRIIKIAEGSVVSSIAVVEKSEDIEEEILNQEENNVNICEEAN